MLILLAPSKTMDFETPVTIKSTEPRFLKQANSLAASLAKLSESELAKLMKISPKLATENYERYQSFPKATSKPALFAYQGDVYRDIHPQNYTDSQLQFAQEHLRILSGLYGILRPLDAIKPYRLEMSIQKNSWKPYLTEAINAENPNYIIGLSSKEYLSPINFRQTKAPLINCHFKTGDRIIPIFSKIARGTMANFIVTHQLTKPEELKDFTDDGWKFESKQSDDSNFVFVRKK